MLHADGGTGQHVAAEFTEIIKLEVYIKIQPTRVGKMLGTLSAVPDDPRMAVCKNLCLQSQAIS